MLGLGATPLAGVMGFATPRDIALDRTILVATADAGGEPVVLIIAPWCEPLETLWRAGVTHAVRRATRWCALFNGASVTRGCGPPPRWKTSTIRPRAGWTVP